MDTQGLIAKLHPFERAVLPILKKEKEVTAIAVAAGLQEIEAMRAVQWLENKKILTITTEKATAVTLGKNGERYKHQGLPEKALLQSLTDSFQSLSQIAKKAKLSTEEINACIGLLKRQGAIIIHKDAELMVKKGPTAATMLRQQTPEEAFLAKSFPLDLRSVSVEEKQVIDTLLKRKEFLKIEEQKTTHVQLTELGKKIASFNLGGEVVNRLTPEMLKTDSWKKKQFRAYDIAVNVPRISGGRKHFDTEAIEYIRQIWLEMGFKEMTGNYIQSAFWDLDTLFVPQDHPAREMQDTFYLEGKAKLPPLFEKIKAVHEHGGKTGSAGWGGSFSKEESEKILLRTHTTVLSAITLSKLKQEDLPAKFFSVDRVFRNEALDWKHLFEFYQVDGIVIDPDANLKHLKGYLTQFYKKMGYSKVRMRPAHFPYTEPSLEVDVFHPVKKEWVELGGAGIFRPEVVQPLLGFDCPVLAWGQGMARIIAAYWKITDIRELYNNDLKQIREAKVWLRG